MSDTRLVRQAFRSTLHKGNAFFLVDGQYGSTGKGLAASYLAEHVGDLFQIVSSNAGPNSGHTSYGPNGEKVVLCQLPTFSVQKKLRGGDILTIMNAGAIIDPEGLKRECLEHNMNWNSVYVHPNAAVVDETATRMEAGMHESIGSTGKGTGGALAQKVMRHMGATVGTRDMGKVPYRIVRSPYPNVRSLKQFVEVSQGFSLSLNAADFYPYCTSRDCTASQALSDAGLHPSDYAGCMMVLRTFPIRVAGNSGPHYSDQAEISWERLGVTPEVTTVTKKVRRVFTWSTKQYIAALEANKPNMLFFNFLNYLPKEDRLPFVRKQTQIYHNVMQRYPDLVLGSSGPLNSDVEVLDV